MSDVAVADFRRSGFGIRHPRRVSRSRFGGRTGPEPTKRAITLRYEEIIGESLSRLSIRKKTSALVTLRNVASGSPEHARAPTWKLAIFRLRRLRSG
jgi:hypothetical protein